MQFQKYCSNHHVQAVLWGRGSGWREFLLPFLDNFTSMCFEFCQLSILLGGVQQGKKAVLTKSCMVCTSLQTILAGLRHCQIPDLNKASQGCLFLSCNILTVKTVNKWMYWELPLFSFAEWTIYSLTALLILSATAIIAKILLHVTMRWVWNKTNHRDPRSQLWTKPGAPLCLPLVRLALFQTKSAITYLYSHRRS